MTTRHQNECHTVDNNCLQLVMLPSRTFAACPAPQLSSANCQQILISCPCYCRRCTTVMCSGATSPAISCRHSGNCGRPASTQRRFISSMLARFTLQAVAINVQAGRQAGSSSLTLGEAAARLAARLVCAYQSATGSACSCCGSAPTAGTAGLRFSMAPPEHCRRCSSGVKKTYKTLH
jgi:hypothetical protein